MLEWRQLLSSGTALTISFFVISVPGIVKATSSTPSLTPRTTCDHTPDPLTSLWAHPPNSPVHVRITQVSFSSACNLEIWPMSDSITGCATSGPTATASPPPTFLPPAGTRARKHTHTCARARATAGRTNSQTPCVLQSTSRKYRTCLHRKNTAHNALAHRETRHHRPQTQTQVPLPQHIEYVHEGAYKRWRIIRNHCKVEHSHTSNQKSCKK